MSVYLLSDRPHHKGIAGRPFVADRHGGVIPYADFLDEPNAGVTAPSVTAFWLLEKMQSLEYETVVGTQQQNTLGSLSYTWVYDPGPPATDTVTLVPDDIAEYVIEHADYPDVLPSMAYRPYKPMVCTANTANATPVALQISDDNPLLQSFPPTGNVVSVQTMRVGRIRGAPSSGYPYYFPRQDEKIDMFLLRSSGPGTWAYREVDETFSGSSIPVYHIMGMANGWSYATQIEPETGIVVEALPMPEPCVVRAETWFYTEAPQSNRDSYNLPPPQTVALSWPTGIRGFKGSAPGTNVAWTGRLFWRPAGDWEYLIGRDDYGTPVDWVGIGTFNKSPTVPTPVDYPGRCYRAVHGGEQRTYLNNFNIGSSAEDLDDWTIPTPTGGGWDILADFTSDPGDPLKEVDAVMGSTLPTEGQEIIIYGLTNRASWSGSTPLAGKPLAFVIYPEPGKCPVPLPLARGGIFGS